MSEIQKFKTFRDLKSVSKSQEQTNTSNTSATSISSSTSVASAFSSASSPSNTSISKRIKHHSDVSPVRDFQKVPNSIPRNLNLFRGKSKQVWDYLWSVSRGAIIPSRTIRKSRREIKEHTKLGSMVTVDAAIGHLESVGLIQINPNIGSLGGNEYEIFTPEEAISSSGISSISSISSPTQKLDDLDILLSSISSTTQTAEKKDSYSDGKTSFKDSTQNDDETRARNGFVLMTERLDAATKKLTGKNVSSREAESWGVLADLLILELEVAAKRTNGISSVPAFLTEVLRRQFFASRQSPSVPKPTQAKTDVVGKSDASAYEIKPLDQAGRESALEHLREFAADEFLQDFKKWYTPEDWGYLIKALKQ